jgi:hypothetical protein
MYFNNMMMNSSVSLVYMQHTGFFSLMLTICSDEPPKILTM